MILLKPKYESIEVLRFPLIIIVVFAHIIPFELHTIKLSSSPSALYTLISELISHILSRLAVSCFFLFSGYFFFLASADLSPQVYVNQLKKRCRTLLLPYGLWNALFVLVVLLKFYLFSSMGKPADELYLRLQAAAWYEILWTGPFLFPLWYLRDLICMTILTPVFYLIFKYTRIFGLLVLLLLYLLCYELGLPGLSTTAFLFFGAGAYFGIYGRDLMQYAEKYSVISGVLAALTLLAALYYSGTPGYEYAVRLFIFSGVIVVLNFGTWLAQRQRVRELLINLSASVFFIYAVHSIYIINWVKGGFARLDLLNAGYGNLLVYFMIPMVCLLISFYIYKFTQRYFPVLMSILTGGRINHGPKSAV
jgi:hypothetical protein